MANPVTVRTTSRTVTFVQPFVLSNVTGVQPAGIYTVDTDEEMRDTALSPSAFRRTATLIHLRATPDSVGASRLVDVNPEELAAALRRDTVLAETPAPRPIVSFARRQAHRAHKKALFEAER